MAEENLKDGKRQWVFTIKTNSGTHINIPKSAAIAVGGTLGIALLVWVGAEAARKLQRY